jgi:hypothetical protein
MSPRVQADKVQKRLRTPRIPSLLFQFELFDKALMKSVSLFIQGFFIARNGSPISALIGKRDFLFDQGFFIRLFQLKHLLLRIVSPQFYICFPTSVF